MKKITKLKEKNKALKLFTAEKTATKNSFSSKQNTDSGNVNLTFTKRDSSTFNNKKLHARHPEQLIKLQRAIKNIVRLHSNPAGQIINSIQ